VGASWQTNPRGGSFRRLGSGYRGSRDGYTSLGDDFGGPVNGGLAEAEPVGLITIEDVIEELLQVPDSMTDRVWGCGWGCGWAGVRAGLLCYGEASREK
jgi:hypothetical protein